MNMPFILIGALLIFDTIMIMSRSNINMGVVMPAILGLPLLFYGLFFDELHLWFTLGVGVIAKWIIIGGYAAFLLLIVMCTALIRSALGKAASDNADALIVLGAGVHGTEISRALKNRLELAVEYFAVSPETVIVVSGGQGRQEAVSEARAMCDYLLSREIPEDKILLEDKARSTYENFKLSKKLLDERFSEVYSVVFTTNDFHIYRAKKAASSAGIDAEGIGCPSPAYIIPNYYIRESMAIVRYALLGIR